jgi:threonyl-tRNA synthetase
MRCLDFMEYVYSVFDLKYELELSTRPDDYLGDLDLWDRAEK